MATLNIGASTPLNIDDAVLAPYKARVQSGEDATKVSQEFFQMVGQDIQANAFIKNAQGNATGATNESFLRKYGYDGNSNSTNYAMNLLSSMSGDSAGIGALSAIFQNKEQPTQYTPGSLTSGNPEVVAGTEKPANTDSDKGYVFNDPNDPGMVAYRERLAAQGQIPQGQTPEGQQSQTGQAPQTQGVPTVPVSNYTGPSVVDYLNSIGQPSDYNSRALLAQRMGIQNYSGTATQNTQLLSSLRGGQTQVNPNVFTSSSPAVISPAPPEMPSAGVNTSLLGQYGLSTPSPQQSPMKSFADTYKELLSNIGVPEIKKEFDNVQKEYDELQNELNDKIIEVNDNPWLSEGIRLKEVQKLQDKYEGKTSILTNKLKLYNSLYEQGVDEAKFVAQQAYQQYQFDTGVQLKLYEIAQKQLDAERDITQQDFENDIALQKLGIDMANAKSSGLSPAQINTTVNSIASAFDGEPVVKEYNTLAAYVNTFNNLGTSATDDQARIYAFAKVMDPNSVVRESEYKTVQEYAQALLKTKGINVARVFTSIGTLTQEARNAMSKTLQTRFDVQQKLYNQVSGDYQRQINDAYSGTPRTITNYQIPQTGGQTGATGVSYDDPAWLTSYNYDQDVASAREAIEQGADRNQILQILKRKYAVVEL